MVRRNRSSGFTLLELLVTIVVLSAVVLSVFQIVHGSRRSMEDQKSLLEAQQNARVALNAISEDFRHVSYGKDPTQPSIYYADTDSVVFVADMFDTPGAERITYFLSSDGDPDTRNPSDTILMKTVTDTTGNVLVAAPQSYGIGATGLALRYFNGSGVEFPAPVANPELIGEIQVTVSGVSSKPLRDDQYHSVTLATTIYPRNLPLTPARSRPNPPGPGPVEIPNCEAVELHWTTPTSNTDGSPLNIADISHLNLYVGTTPDNMSLNTRLARTFTTWTVTDLEGGNEYYIHVTVVSRVGVESYPYRVTVDLATTSAPAHVQDVEALADETGVHLSWSPVTLFDDGELIVTPVYYKIYRGTYAAFPADEAHLVGQTGESVTSYTDAAALDDCMRLYYRVTAIACNNEGESSATTMVTSPAPASCVSNVHATLGGAPGDVLLSWSAPTTRIDGSAIGLDEIRHYVAYYDTIPGSYADSALSVGPSPSVLITGLPLCRMFYFNVRPVDTCETPGDICPANQVAIATSSPCDPGIPAAPASVEAAAGETYIQLTWSPNRTDCDLAGYRVYYGYYSDGPYDGVGAAEGVSPISVEAGSVTMGDVCRFTLTGLDLCQDVYLAVTSTDLCVPANESEYSPQVMVPTTCAPCNIAQSCWPWAVKGPTNQEVLFRVYNEAGIAEPVTAMRVTWTGPTLLHQVKAGGVLVWSSDGAAGSDGNIGPVASGRRIHPASFTVPVTATQAAGHPMELIFTGDVRGLEIQTEFYADSAPCSAAGVATAALVLDDFGDGNYTGWTTEGGTWAVSSGALRQTATTGEPKFIYATNPSHGGNFVYAARTRLDSGSISALQFNRSAVDRRYLAQAQFSTDYGILARADPTFTSLAQGSWSLVSSTWYTIRIEKTEGVYKYYGNCNLICQASVWPLPPAGNFGLGTYSSSARFDDICVVGW
jgi:prepilin-type N-terminal cleavage/methylation domain-containing protein